MLPAWLRTLLLWAHLVAVVAWLGAIIFVHLVQTPKVAGQGIPRGYLKLAWPSICVLGVSGVVLTLGDISGFGMLTDGRWGRILLTKISIYVVLACIALFATLVMSPRLRRMSDRHQGRRGGQEQFRADGRVTFGYAGKIYDVTGSRLWREGRHAKRHEGWQDLTVVAGRSPARHRGVRAVPGGRRERGSHRATSDALVRRGGVLQSLSRAGGASRGGGLVEDRDCGRAVWWDGAGDVRRRRWHAAPARLAKDRGSH